MQSFVGNDFSMLRRVTVYIMGLLVKSKAIDFATSTEIGYNFYFLGTSSQVIFKKARQTKKSLYLIKCYDQISFRV